MWRSGRQILFLLSTVFFIPSLAFSQLKVKGRIIDEESREPLTGVWIHLEGKHIGSISDAEGRYVLEPGQTGPCRIHAEFIGYKPVVVKVVITRDTIINFELQKEDGPQELEQVIIVSKQHTLRGFSSEIGVTSSRSQEQISRMDGENLIDALATLPGIKTLNTGIGVNKPVINGLYGSRVTIIEDGVRQEEQQWGGDHGVNIMSNTADAISVFTGASTLIFGSGASGGAMVLESEKFKLSGDSVILNTEAGFRSVNDHFNYNLKLAKSLGKLTLIWHSEGATFGDYRVPAQEFNYVGFVLPIAEYRLKNTAGNRLSNRLTIQWKTSNFTHEAYGSVFMQKAGFFTGAIGSPNAYDLTPDGDFRNIDFPYQENRHSKIFYSAEREIEGKKMRFELAFQDNVRKEISRAHAHGRPEGFNDSLALNLQLMTVSSNLRFSRANARQKLNYGVQGTYQDNRANGYEYLIPSYYSIEGSMYGIYSYRLSTHWSAEAGSRIDARYLESKKEIRPFYYHSEYIGEVERSPLISRSNVNLAAKAGMKYDYRPWKMGLFIARSNRMLNIAELASNGMHHGAFRYEQGQSNLKPESGVHLNWNIERKGHLDAGKFSSRFEFNIEAYYSYFQNYVYLAPSGRFATLEVSGTVYPFPEPGQVYEYRQSPVVHTGFNSWLRIISTKKGSIESGGDYVFIRNAENGLPIPFTPPASIYLKYRYSFFKFPENNVLENSWIEITGRKVFPQDQVAINENSTDGYQLLDASFSVKWKKHWKVSLYGHNLFNTKYLSHLSRYRLINVPEPGRNISVKLTFQL